MRQSCNGAQLRRHAMNFGFGLREADLPGFGLIGDLGLVHPVLHVHQTGLHPPASALSNKPVVRPMRLQMKSIRSFLRPGANHSRSRSHVEDLQSRTADEGALSCFEISVVEY